MFALLALVASLGAVAYARNDNAIYVQVALSLGKASALNDTNAEPTKCPVFTIPHNLTGQYGEATPFPWSVANASNPYPIPSFWLQEGSCNFLVLPFETSLLNAFQVQYKATLYPNATGDGKDTVNFKYFCQPGCTVCAFNVNVTVGVCDSDADRRFVALGAGQDRNAIVRVQNYMTQGALRNLIATNSRLISGSPATTTVIEQFYDKTCGGNVSDPVMIRTGFVVDATGRSVDCVIGGLTTTSSYEVACSATQGLKVLQHLTGSTCSSFDDSKAAGNITGALPIQPATVVAASGKFTTCAGTCGAAAYNYVSTYAYCGGQSASLPAAQAASACPTAAPTAPPATAAPSTSAAAATAAAAAAALFALVVALAF